MSSENFKNFVSALKSDTQLQQTLRDRTRDNNKPEVVFSVAREAGFPFEMSHMNESGRQSLSEDQLSDVSGGATAGHSMVLGKNHGI